ncbi:RNA polymerase sigma factor [Pedobacter nyackensis]|uniref:RNA polymerase sigma-70 factor, ECF subfamily n=1 Tax=Pedobacter nyackensis TaxID=475255 RepID=A0A1W2ADS1_9SPHI|nr:sigma-70 family RNA polymerase sigma factor [Pedobacter nyackensis]SMC58418.1 RNA polymerase sigma-70 factor, ECF subfamily [Pedobacter nyackensis]
MRSPTLLNERELLLLLKQGDDDAFEEIYHLYSHRLYSNLLKLVKSDDLAMDLLQDLYIKLWNNRSSIDVDKSIRSYLFSIAKNLAIDFFRRAARESNLQNHLITVGTELYNHVDDVLFHKETAVVLNKAIMALPPQQQKIFNLCKIEGRSYQEVALILGISPATVGNQLVKALRSVRAVMMNSQDALIIIVSLILTRGIK